ncbi:DUF1648 domain-containing protein [Streptomyces sp. TP-A0874]
MAVVFIVSWPKLPDPMAIHFGAGGRWQPLSVPG